MKPQFSLAVAVLCASIVVGQVPVKYNAMTGLAQRSKPPLPALGRAGTWIVDPTFRSRIVRVTDPDTLPGYYQGRSYMTFASAEQDTWNADGTIFVLSMTGGWTVPFSFDPATLAVSRMGDLSNSTGGLVLSALGGPCFSFSDPRLVYGIASGTSGTSVVQYDFSTGTTTTLLRLDTLVSGAGRRAGDVSVSADEKISVYFGGTAQDTDPYVVVFDKATGRTTLLDTLRSTIDGKPAGATLGRAIHNARLDKSGRYVVITAVGGPLTIWDVQAGTLISDPYLGFGHKVSGFGDMINSDLYFGEYGPQWLHRILDPAGIHQPKGLLIPDFVGPWWDVYNHLSWNNAQPGARLPVLISTYHDSRKNMVPRGLEDEIIAVRTDGVPTVWRFAHHRSVYAGNFWDTPRGNVSQDGRFFMFTSNWEKTLGVEKSGNIRRDVFIVELAPPALQLSPLSAALSARQSQQFTVTGNTGLPVTWSISPNVGAISAGGLYTAPDLIPANQTVMVTATGGLHGQVASGTVTLRPSATIFVPIRVNAGGPAYTDAQGVLWKADTGYLWGAPWKIQETVSNTDSPALYQSVRYGVGFKYQFAVPNGTYQVKLKFAEVTQPGPGKRVFHVALNGTPILTNFDIYAEAGGPRIALDKSFTVTVSGGQILLQFSTGPANSPMVNAIEIASAAPGGGGSSTPAITPIRVNAGGADSTDAQGVLWKADTGYLWGAPWKIQEPVSNTDSPALYQSVRYGVGFKYQFAVPNGTYQVKLKFAEVTQPGPGKRVFHVALNGTSILTNFDIYAEAGGPRLALDKSFTVTASGGQILLEFSTGPANSPMVNAIEITPIP